MYGDKSEKDLDFDGLSAFYRAEDRSAPLLKARADLWEQIEWMQRETVKLWRVEAEKDPSSIIAEGLSDRLRNIHRLKDRLGTLRAQKLLRAAILEVMVGADPMLVSDLPPEDARLILDVREALREYRGRIFPEDCRWTTR